MIIKSTDVVPEEKFPNEIKQRHSYLRTSMISIHDSARKSLMDLGRIILFNSSEDLSTSIDTPPNNVEGCLIENKRALIFDGELLTLRILFIDIMLILCALVSDLVQATSILQNSMNKDKLGSGGLRFAFAAFAIIWVPGIPASIHYLASFRHKLVWYKSVGYAMLMIMFYPIVPIITKLVLIWIQPKDNKITKEFLEAEYGATVAYAIHGCISAPIQLCYQSWLVLNGIVSFEFTGMVLDLSKVDWGSNEGKITWPSTELCLIFSILT